MTQRRPDSAYMIRNTDISNAGYDVRMLTCQQYYMLSFDMPTFMQIGFHLILSYHVDQLRIWLILIPNECNWELKIEKIDMLWFFYNY